MKMENSNIRALKLLNSFSPSYFSLMVLTSFFSNLSPYYNIYLSAEILNEIAGNRNVKLLTILIFVTVVGNLLISIIKGFISKRLTESEIILSNAETQYYMKKLLHMDYSNFENPDIRQLRRKITESAKINNHGRQLLLKSVGRIVDAIISTMIALFLSVELLVKSFYSSSWQLASIFCFIIIFLMAANVIYNIKIKDINADAANNVSKTMIENNRIDNAIESYNMGKDIRLYRQNSIIMKIKNKRLSSHREAFERFSMFQLKTSVPLYVLTTLLNISVYIYIVYNYILGAFGIGSIIKYVGISQKLIECILGIFRSFADIKSNTRYVNDYLAYFDIPHNMQKGKKSVYNETDAEYIIEFRDVSFKYPVSNEYALKNVSVKITSGEKIGIVGQNGSGKTTFIKLLCRLYDPTAGEIFFNGINVKEYDYREYLSVLSVVFQDFKLFSFSLSQNISGSEKFDTNKVEDCLYKVGFRGRLNKMENGINTCLYKDFDINGIEISGGEAQKIALARALYKDASIIILDEPTATLDPNAEYEIYTQFNDMIKHKTAVLVTHRLSAVQLADKVAVFDNGSVVEYGTHKELYEKGGIYTEMFDKQAQFYRDEKSSDN